MTDDTYKDTAERAFWRNVTKPASRSTEEEVDGLGRGGSGERRPTGWKPRLVDRTPHDND